MKLEIITPNTKLYEGDVNSVLLPGSLGEFEILKNHAPIISILTKGTVRVTDKTEKVENFEINGGVIETLQNKIVVLAE